MNTRGCSGEDRDTQRCLGCHALAGGSRQRDSCAWGFSFSSLLSDKCLSSTLAGLVFKSQSCHSPAVGLGAKDLTSPGLRFLPVKWEE